MMQCKLTEVLVRRLAHVLSIDLWPFDFEDSARMFVCLSPSVLRLSTRISY